ncbi:hypothetical protein B0G66_101301 [Bacillus badius]|nr:hypothetical protein B0G66_101301 [Bacillus badius]
MLKMTNVFYYINNSIKENEIVVRTMSFSEPREVPQNEQQ